MGGANCLYIQEAREPVRGAARDMRYVVGLMMVAFFLGGVGLFAAGVRGLIRRFAARRRLRPAEGEIVRIEKRQEITDNEMRRTAEYHYPEIKFRLEGGPETNFLSEIGAVIVNPLRGPRQSDQHFGDLRFLPIALRASNFLI